MVWMIWSFLPYKFKVYSVPDNALKLQRESKKTLNHCSDCKLSLTSSHPSTRKNSSFPNLKTTFIKQWRHLIGCMLSQWLRIWNIHLDLDHQTYSIRTFRGTRARFAQRGLFEFLCNKTEKSLKSAEITC